MGTISYLSSFDTGTRARSAARPRRAAQRLGFGWDILAVAVLGVVIYVLAIRIRLPAERTLEYVGDPTSEAEADED